MAISIGPRPRAIHRIPLGLGILACIVAIIGLGQSLQGAEGRRDDRVHQAEARAEVPNAAVIPRIEAAS